MSTFSTNQVRQLYVANSFKATPVVDADPVGTIAVGSNNNKDLYFTYRGVDSIQRSDLINVDQVKFVKATSSSNLRRGLRKTRVTLDPNVNGGILVVQQEYILRIIFREYVGISPEDQYFKHGTVLVTSGMTTAQFWAAMAVSLNNSWGRAEKPLLTFTADATGLVIEEVEQPWQLGTISSVPVNFDVSSLRILVNGDDVHWSVVTKLTPTTFVENGKVIADLEHFCMGERGDMYRLVGFPKVIRTTYLVDPTSPYNVFDLHFYYVGANEAVQKSEKTITIVAIDADVIKDIVGVVNTALAKGNTNLQAVAI